MSIPGEFIERRKWKKVGNWSFYTPDYVYEKMQKENQTTAMYQGKKIRIEHIMSFRDIDYSSIPREYIDSDLLILDKDKDCIQDLYVVGNKKFYFKEDFLQALKSLDEGQGICCFQLRDPILIPRS